MPCFVTLNIFVLMCKHKYPSSTASPLEAVEVVHSPPEIISDSDLTVDSCYSSCLRKGITAMSNYSNGSEGKQPERQLVFTKKFKEDLKYWKKNCGAKYTRIQEFIEEIKEKPFEGKGNPKPLTHLYYDGHKVSSREINDEHRLTYVVTSNTVYFLQARYHYTKNKNK